MKIIKEPAKGEGTEEGDQGKGEANLHALGHGDLVTPERKEEDIGQDGDPKSDKDVEEGLGRAGPGALSFHLNFPPRISLTMFSSHPATSGSDSTLSLL